MRARQTRYVCQLHKLYATLFMLVPLGSAGVYADSLIVLSAADSGFTSSGHSYGRSFGDYRGGTFDPVLGLATSAGSGFAKGQVCDSFFVNGVCCPLFQARMLRQQRFDELYVGQDWWSRQGVIGLQKKLRWPPVDRTVDGSLHSALTHQLLDQPENRQFRIEKPVVVPTWYRVDRSVFLVLSRQDRTSVVDVLDSLPICKYRYEVFGNDSRLDFAKLPRITIDFADLRGPRVKGCGHQNLNTVLVSEPLTWALLGLGAISAASGSFYIHRLPGETCG